MRIVCGKDEKREKRLLIARMLLMVGLTLVACGEENREPEGSCFVEAGDMHPLEDSTAPEGVSESGTPESIDESKFIKEPFEDILGYDGVKVQNQSIVMPYETAYYSEVDGDGGADTLIYRREGDKILRGTALELLDGEYDNVSFASQRAKYLPEENMVEIHYYRQAVDEQLSKKYEIDFDRITYWEEVDITQF